MSRPAARHEAERRKRSAFLARTSAALGVPAATVEDLFQPQATASGRINRLRVERRSDVVEELAEAGIATRPLPWYPDGLVFDAPKAAVAATAAVTEGRFFIQNASSFLPPLALGAAPADAVLDACSAPGAKASHVAALTGGAASLWLNDGISTRLDRIADVQATLGFAADEVTAHPAQYLDKFVDRTFDRALVDAQCSGEGLVDLRSPTALRYWSLARITKYRHLQTKMLVAAFRLLRPGGTLVYSTCTVAPEENEAPVSTLLARQPDAYVDPLRLDDPSVRPGLLRWEGERFDPAVAGALRVVPSGPMEAFFVCRIRKGPGTPEVVDLGEEGRRRSGD